MELRSFLFESLYTKGDAKEEEPKATHTDRVFSLITSVTHMGRKAPRGVP